MEGRYDPNFYTTANLQQHHVVAKLPWRVTALGKINVDIFQGVGRALSENDRYRLLKVKNVGLDGNLNLNDFESISADAIVFRKLLQHGDVIAPFIGEAIRQNKVAVFRGEEGIYTVDNNTGVIRNNEPELLSEFLALFLKSSFGNWQIQRRVGGGGVPFLGTGSVRKLLIPIPPMPVQEAAVKTFAKSKLESQKLLTQAEKLLASIDDYLLAELGITLPTEPDNSINNRIFTAQRRELVGWRFDPLFHSFKLWHAIDEAHVPTKKLGVCCHYLKSGFAAGGDMQQFDEEGVIQLRPTNIDADRELVFDRNVYLDQVLLQAKPDDIVQCGEVLFNNTNSQELVGKTVYLNIEGQPFFCSNHITRISTISSELNPEYLTAILNAYQRLRVFFSLCTNWNNQSGVNVELLRHLPIPVPDINKQEAIALHIGEIRGKAKQLRQQAEAELETAKQTIEALLLGETP
jgi:restriction endonuclease S subunit